MTREEQEHYEKLAEHYNADIRHNRDKTEIDGVKTELDTRGDCISRDMALEKMADYVSSGGYADSVNDFEEYSKIIRELPSVNPQERTGHWIEDDKTYYEELNKRGLGVDEYTPYFTDDIACSECLAKYSMLDNETQFFKHCPNCGAKMESEG